MSIEKASLKCMGCGICKMVCPTDAINMEMSEDGFLYPQINDKKCVNCDLCEKKCPVLDTEKRQSVKSAFYGKAKDEEVVARSSSGGAFSVFAEKILKDGGVIFGAVFDKESKEVLYKSSDEVTLDNLRRSKYVESKIGDSFFKAKEQLDSGRKVLFVGMPCHITGLLKFLNREYENLITCDFICGGAASPLNFKEHLEYLEKKYKSKVKAVNFRPKFYGWTTQAIKVDFQDGQSYKNYAAHDTYFKGFMYESAIKRSSCFNCGFRDNHCADIIIADFWGHRQHSEIMLDDKGTSLMISNSSKGEEFLRSISQEEMEIAEIPKEYTDYAFTPFKNPAEMQEKKDNFMKQYRKYGFERGARKAYLKNYKMLMLKKFIKGMLKK